jgi:dipeptidyl-peptidase-4
VRMRLQYLCSLGFLIFTLDNRGSARRGLLFEGGIKNDMGHLEVEDQVDGVNWLVQQGLADPQRVGIFGWSYGGYMAAMCLGRAPETFKAAVAGAPVTAWDGYDTHYTERYMGTPQSNPQGYQASSVMEYIPQMTGKLMLVHGLIDENVHFRHTARLINALIAARKTYDLLLFPDERHSPRRLADRVYMEERIRDFFLDALR